MPKYKINISPSVYQIVDANNEEEAVKIVKAEIAKGAVSPIYDKLYFDYETGVPVKSLRRKLARAETAEEQEQLLQKIVGSDGFTRNTTVQLALTPKGLQQLNLPYQSIKLQDGTEIRKNTIIDENKFNLSTGDLSDFMGVVGPIAGAIAAFSPQLRILKGVTSLLGGKKFAGRLLTSGLGTGGGKLGEEVVDALEGFQLQENDELAKLFGQEFLLGLGGQAIGEGVGLAFNKTIGAKEPTENLRLMFQGAKKRSIDDVKKLDEKLGKPATEKQIKQAIKDGENMDCSTLDIVEQGYLSSWIEQNYDFIQTPLTRNFFSDTNEILEYVKYYPNHYKAMNPNLPKFNNIDNPFHLWAKNKSSKQCKLTEIGKSNII